MADTKLSDLSAVSAPVVGTDSIYIVRAGASNKTAVSTVLDFIATAAAQTVLDDATVAAMVDTLGGASSTGTGGLVRKTSAALVTPDLGTPSAAVLTNATGLPTAGIVDAAVTLAKMANLAQDQFIGRTTASTGVPETATITAAARTVLDDTTVAAMVDTLGGASSSGTGGLARLTSPSFTTPALGTPSALVLTNATALPAAQLVAGTLAASSAFTFGENTELKLDAALSADGKFCGITEAGTAGATLAFGDLVYLAVADSRWELTDADADSTSGAVKIGICVLAAAADGDPTTILLWGKIRADANFPTLTVGSPVYVSTTAGDVQVAQPSGTDDVIRIIGYGNTADELFFCPSPDYMTHT